MSDHPDAPAAEQIVFTEHARGEGIRMGESWVLTPGSLPYREAGERVLSALDVPVAEWPRQPSRTAEDARERTGSAGGENPAPASPEPVAAILTAPVTASVLRSQVRAAVHAWAETDMDADPADAVMGVVAPWAEQMTGHAVALAHAALERATERMRAAEGKLTEIRQACRDQATYVRLGAFDSVVPPTALVKAADILAIIGTGEEGPLAPDTGHLSAADRAMVARVTGGGIRSREMQVEFSDEQGAGP